MGNKEETRAKLLKAAYEVMRERGFVGATSREIASRAGMSEGSIWVHFGSKFNLCLAVIAEPFMEPLDLNELTAQAGKRPARQVLLDIATWMVSRTEKFWDIYSGALQHPETRESVLAHAQQNRAAQKMLRRIADYVAAEQKNGGIPVRHDPMMFTHLLIGTLFYHALQVLTYGEDGVASPGGSEFPAHLVDSLLEA